MTRFVPFALLATAVLVVPAAASAQPAPSAHQHGEAALQAPVTPADPAHDHGAPGQAAAPGEAGHESACDCCEMMRQMMRQMMERHGGAGMNMMQGHGAQPPAQGDAEGEHQDHQADRPQ